MVLNSYVNGELFNEEVASAGTFAEGGAFDIVMVFRRECYEVIVNGLEYWTFKHCLRVEKLTTLNITGDHLTSTLLAAALLSSFGSSMLYGYNLAVVNSPAQYIKDFFNHTAVRRKGSGLSNDTITVLYSITVSIFAIGGLVGSLTVGILVTKFGRKGTLLKSTVLVFVAGGLMGLSRHIGVPEMIIIGRFITGIHSGISLSVVPMFLGEIAPKNLRGFLGFVPSIFICIGVFIAQILGLLGRLKCHVFSPQEEHWPLFLSLVVIPPVFQLMLLPWFPESPRYLLIEKHNIHATVNALRWYRGKADIQVEVEEMQKEQRSLSSVRTVSVYELLRDRAVRWQVISVMIINMGMQLSGIDAIWFYTNAIFENAGIPVSQVQYTTVGTGAIEVIAGLIGCFTIERVGRRPLLIGGYIFMGLCCAGITFSLLLQAHVSFMHYVSMICVVGIIAGFCIGPAGVPFLMTGELFKQSHRPSAYIVGGALNWLSNFTVGFFFPFLQMSAGAFCYLVFFGICVGVAAYVYFIIPETKNKTFVEISQMFAFRNNCELESEQLLFTENHNLRMKNRYGSMENKGREEMYMWSDDT
ncbi:Solute carrier family 2, facilitated glucose transporter member 9 [Bagarius yarrelli]|uniref:Solute carrier family 2, facilitated glucose transporter member 9 n=1 Tax=Bagarius yarrelli TaxID=175774 RepID=A0A556TKV4_BAGYA|nr:Solute carrier family 2, facilitated glucose transporter member 9 [Bagarius yarrelli]